MRATRRQKSGLSMVISAAGAAARAALAAAQSGVSARNTSAAPRQCPLAKVRPSGTDFADPAPASSRRQRLESHIGFNCFSAAIRAAPSRSPEGSPAIRKKFMRATTRTGPLVFCLGHRWQIKADHHPAAQAMPPNCAAAARRTVSDSERRQVDAKILARFGRLVKQPRAKCRVGAQGWQRRHAVQHRIGSGQASTPRHRPCATTAPCPTSTPPRAATMRGARRIRLVPAGKGSARSGRGRAKARGQVGHAEHRETGFFENRDHLAQDGIIARLHRPKRRGTSVAVADRIARGPVAGAARRRQRSLA